MSTPCLTLNKPSKPNIEPPFAPLQALYNEYVHFKETEIPEKEVEKGHIEHLYKLLEVRKQLHEPEMEEVNTVCSMGCRLWA